MIFHTLVLLPYPVADWVEEKGITFLICGEGERGVVKRHKAALALTPDLDLRDLLGWRQAALSHLVSASPIPGFHSLFPVFQPQASVYTDAKPAISVFCLPHI